MSTSAPARIHDDAVALVREAVSEYLPYARARRRELDNDSWAALMGEVLDVVAHTD